MAKQSIGEKNYFMLNSLARSDAHNENAFDALRFLAAFLVLFSHSYALYGLSEPRPIAGYKLGSIAVFVFFAISGFWSPKAGSVILHFSVSLCGEVFEYFPDSL